MNNQIKFCGRLALFEFQDELFRRGKFCRRKLRSIKQCRISAYLLGIVSQSIPSESTCVNYR